MIDASPSQAGASGRAWLTSSSIINTQASSVFHVISFRHSSPHLRCHSVFLYIKDVYLSSKVKSVAHPSPFLIGTDTRSIALRISPCSCALLFIISLRSIHFISLCSIFSSSAERQWLSTPVAVRYVPHPFVHYCERILRYIPLRYHSGVSL